jgi:hypothetical protein
MLDDVQLKQRRVTGGGARRGGRLLAFHDFTVGQFPGGTGIVMAYCRAALTERFKSDNALLRNSLSYVTRLSASSGFHDRDLRLRALATAVLQLALDSSARSQQAVEEGLLDLAVQPPVEPDQGTAQALASPARLLKILLPSVDDTLGELFAVQTGTPLEEARTRFARLHIASESSAQRFRLLLYATSVLLALALIDLGRRLRARAVALRKRAAFEHLIAEQSARLINCPPAETKARLEQALAEFGRTIEADRVYIVLGETLSGFTLGPRTMRPIPWVAGEGSLLAGRVQAGRARHHYHARRRATPFWRRTEDAARLRNSRLGVRRVAASGL